MTQLAVSMIEYDQLEDHLQEKKAEAGEELGAYFADHKLSTIRVENFRLAWVRGSHSGISKNALLDNGVSAEVIEKCTVSTPWKKHTMVVTKEEERPVKKKPMGVAR